MNAYKRYICAFLLLLAATVIVRAGDRRLVQAFVLWLHLGRLLLLLVVVFTYCWFTRAGFSCSVRSSSDGSFTGLPFPTYRDRVVSRPLREPETVFRAAPDWLNLIAFPGAYSKRLGRFTPVCGGHGVLSLDAFPATLALKNYTGPFLTRRGTYGSRC